MLALVVGVLVVGAGAALAVSRSGGDGPDHPDAWDPKVAPLAKFVEETRGRDFDHPVYVRFLSPAEYRKRVTDDGGDEPTKQDREDADRSVAADRALGLVQGDLDPFETSDDIGSDGTAAFYDPATDAVYVNGEDLDVSGRVTVVHELTHALQSQIVAADATGDDEGGPPDDTIDAGLAYQSLVEGDATSVEDAYVAQLSDQDFDAYDSDSSAAADDSQAALDQDQVPGAYQAAFALPYALGQPWVDAVIGRDGPEAIAKALVRPPATTASLVDLERPADDDPAHLTAPTPAAGAKVLDTDRWGPASWLVPLAEYTDGKTAFEAVRSWQGDSVVTSRAGGGPVCVDAVVRLADGPAAERFANASRRWFAALPPQAGATVAATGDDVALHSCDPGPTATIKTTGKAMDELSYVVARNQGIAELLAEGIDSTEDAACVIDRLLDTFGADRLTNDEDLAGSDELMNEAKDAATACGVGG